MSVISKPKRAPPCAKTAVKYRHLYTTLTFGVSKINFNIIHSILRSPDGVIRLDALQIGDTELFDKFDQIIMDNYDLLLNYQFYKTNYAMHLTSINADMTYHSSHYPPLKDLNITQSDRMINVLKILDIINIFSYIRSGEWDKI